jgi:hypothetical protein
MFKHNSTRDMVPLKDIHYNDNDNLNILETGIPKMVLERYIQHPNDVIAIIAQLNAGDIKIFIRSLLQVMNTPEFGNFLNEIFNDNYIKNQILDIYEKFVTSVRNKNSVANAYLKEINPVLRGIVTKWVGFGKLKKKHNRHHRAVIEQTDLIKSIIEEFNEDTQKRIYKRLCKKIKKRHALNRHKF